MDTIHDEIRQTFRNAMLCVEREGECRGCPLADTVACMDILFTDTNTIQKSEMLIQMYLLGGYDMGEG